MSSTMSRIFSAALSPPIFLWGRTARGEGTEGKEDDIEQDARPIFVGETSSPINVVSPGTSDSISPAGTIHEGNEGDEGDVERCAWRPRRRKDISEDLDRYRRCILKTMPNFKTDQLIVESSDILCGIFTRNPSLIGKITAKNLKN